MRTYTNLCDSFDVKTSFFFGDSSGQLRFMYNFWNKNSIYIDEILCYTIFVWIFSYLLQRYTYRVLQTIQIELILLCVWAEPAVLGSAKTALKFKYEI